MPPQKKQRARTRDKGAAKAKPSRRVAPRESNGKAAQRAARKERRPTPRKDTKDQGDGRMTEKTRKVALPGEMYERSGRWWWRVRLPGEPKAKARPLRAPGAKTAAHDPDTAEKIAVEMWEQAVAQTGARQITLDCTQKVERLKAQFLDKVRHLTGIVEAANAKARAEAQARAELEARLNAGSQTAEQPTETPSARIQNSAPPVPEPTASVEIQSEPATQAVHEFSATPSPRPELPDCRPRTPEPGPEEMVETVSFPTPEPSGFSERSHIPESEAGVCECCGAAGIPVSDLAPIDSGQLLCPDCLSALRIDVSRIEAKACSDSRA